MEAMENQLEHYCLYSFNYVKARLHKQSDTQHRNWSKGIQSPELVLDPRLKCWCKPLKDHEWRNESCKSLCLSSVLCRTNGPIRSGVDTLNSRVNPRPVGAHMVHPQPTLCSYYATRAANTGPDIDTARYWHSPRLFDELETESAAVHFLLTLLWTTSTHLLIFSLICE